MSSPSSSSSPSPAGPDPRHPTTTSVGPTTPPMTATATATEGGSVAGGTMTAEVDGPYFAPHVGVVPIQRPSGEDYDTPHSLSTTLSSLRQLVASFDSVSESLLKSIDVQFRRVQDLERRCVGCRVRLDELKKLRDTGEAVTVRAPSSHRSFSDGAAGAAGGGQKRSALKEARIASNNAVYRQIVRDLDRDDGLAVPSDSWLDRASADDGSDVFGDDGGFDEVGGCRRAVDMFRSVPSSLYSHGVARLEAEEAAVEEKMARLASDQEEEDLRRLKIGAVNDALRRMREASLDEELDRGGGGAAGHHRPPRSVGAGSARSAGASAAVASADGNEGDLDDTVSILTLDSSFPRAATAAHARQQHHQQQRQRRGQGTPRASNQRHQPAAAAAGGGTNAQRHQAASGSLPYLCELLHDARGVGDSIPEEASSTRDLFAFRGGKPLYGLGGNGGGIADDEGAGAGDGPAGGAAPAEGAVASAASAASTASPRTGGGTTTRATTARTVSSVSSSLSPLRLLEDGGGVGGGRTISVASSPPPSPGRIAAATATATATATIGSSATGFAGGGGGGGGGASSDDVVVAPAAPITSGDDDGGDDGLAYYRPRSIPHDAGRFDMPTNLPLSDVAYIPSSRGDGAVVDTGGSTSSSKKDVPEEGVEE